MYNFEPVHFNTLVLTHACFNKPVKNNIPLFIIIVLSGVDKQNFLDHCFYL